MPLKINEEKAFLILQSRFPSIHKLISKELEEKGYAYLSKKTIFRLARQDSKQYISMSSWSSHKLRIFVLSLLNKIYKVENISRYSILILNNNNNNREVNQYA